MISINIRQSHVAACEVFSNFTERHNQKIIEYPITAIIIFHGVRVLNPGGRNLLRGFAVIEEFFNGFPQNWIAAFNSAMD